MIVIKTYKVKYELRDYHTRVVEARTLKEAEEIVCNEAWRRHKSDIYDILLIEQVSNDSSGPSKQ